MNYIKKYKIFIILILLEFAFYIRVNITNNEMYFSTWSFIGIFFLLYNIFNVIKSNPIISLFTLKNRNNKIQQQSTIKERLFSSETKILLIFISINFLLYIFY